MDKELFTRRLESWSDWGRVFQDREAFAGVTSAIYQKQGWGTPEALEQLTPGTHGVFKEGGRVVKIYAPCAVGFSPRQEQASELSAMGRAREAGIAVPRVLAQGVIEDRYGFYYIVTEYIEGPEAGPWLRGQSLDIRGDFCRSLGGMLAAYHGTPGPGDMEPIRRRAVENPRWEGHSPALVWQAGLRLEQMPLTQGVWVHGDLTCDNVLITPQGPVIIDFADGCFAPEWYEWPPLFSDLLGGDREMIGIFTAGMPKEKAAQRLCDALLIHDFGPDILSNIILKQMNESQNPDDLKALVDLCRRYLG